MSVGWLWLLWSYHGDGRRAMGQKGHAVPSPLVQEGWETHETQPHGWLANLQFEAKLPSWVYWGSTESQFMDTWTSSAKISRATTANRQTCKKRMVIIGCHCDFVVVYYTEIAGQCSCQGMQDQIKHHRKFQHVLINQNVDQVTVAREIKKKQQLNVIS